MEPFKQEGCEVLPVDRKLRILLTSAGRRVELLRCFREAGAQLGAEVAMLACDLRPEVSAACQDADACFAVPRADGPDYVPALLDLCATRDVGLLVPTIDTELQALSAAREGFEALGTRVAVSAEPLVRMARDKLATARFLAEHGIAAPRTEAIEAIGAAPDRWAWPLFVKARHGSSSRGAQVVRDAEQLAALAPAEPMIGQTLLSGAEYTVNMFFDGAGTLRCAVPHHRLQVRAGEVDRA
jgi:carbamoyl-phosphate synthase large subunit